MAFSLSQYIGLTTNRPDDMIKMYCQLFGMEPSPSIDGLELKAGNLSFFIDPGQRQPPILELITPDLDIARPILRSFGFQEQTWHGSGKLNLVTDPFGISWNIFEGHANLEVDYLSPVISVIPPKIALHLHETEKAAHFYADLLNENSTRTPSGWTIDSNKIRLIIEPGIPHGVAFFVDSQSASDPTSIQDFFSSKSTQVDQFGVTWKLVTRPTAESAVISAQ